MRFITTKPKGFLESYFIYGIDEDATGVGKDGQPWRGLVICKLVDTSHDVRDFLERLGRGKSSFCLEQTFHSYHKEEFLIKNEYVGRAKCSVEDVFDLNEGMKIARERALRKYRRDKSAQYLKAMVSLGVMVDQLYKELDFLNKEW